MSLWISGDIDMKPVTRLRTNKFHQLISMMKLAVLAHARGKISAQSNDALNA
jgi:hypothetical protein